MFWTNLMMTGTALIIAACLGELGSGVKFCVENPVILNKIIKFAICSAGAYMCDGVCCSMYDSV